MSNSTTRTPKGAKASRATKPSKTVTAPALIATEAAMLSNRIASARITTVTIDRKIEEIYGCVERGAPIDPLLSHISGSLTRDAWRFLEVEPLTRADVEASYAAMFPLIGALHGATALAAGSPLQLALQAVLESADQLQNECGELCIHPLLPTTQTDRDFLRGRDLAVSMLNRALSAPVDSSSSKRWHRDGAAQQNFAADYIGEILGDERLLHGFSAVLSAALASDEANCPQAFADMSKAEVQAGAPGADGTETEESAIPEVAHNTNLSVCRAAAAKASAALTSSIDLDEELVSGNVVRLTRAALQSLEMLETDSYWTDNELHETCFDALALVEAAVNVTDDNLSPNRVSLLGIAKTEIEAAIDHMIPGATAATAAATHKPEFQDLVIKGDRREFVRAAACELTEWNDMLCEMIDVHAERVASLGPVILRRSNVLANAILSAADDREMQTEELFSILNGGAL